MTLSNNRNQDINVQTISKISDENSLGKSFEIYEIQLLPMNELVQEFAEVSFKYKEVNLIIALAITIYIIFNGMTKFLVAVIEVLNKQK